MPRIGETSGIFKCDFCTKPRKQVKRLVANDGVYIHDECIRLCSEIIEEGFPRVGTFELQEELPKSKEVRDFLDQYVIGQDTAKKALAVAICDHYKHITSEQTRIGRSCQGEEPVKVGKSNILLIGSAGCGKTYLVQALARMLSVPFAMVNATALVGAGYMGEDVGNILLKLIQAADLDIKKAETRIIYIGEIGKVARKSGDPSITHDASSGGVQQALLKILKGIVASVPLQSGYKYPHQDFLQTDTTEVLFTVGGAFAGLDEIINSHIGERPLGLSVDTSVRKGVADPFSEVRPEDLHELGPVPEFIGCLLMISTVSPLGHEALNRTLVEPRNALTKQFARLFEFNGMQLNFANGAIDAIVEPTLERGTGTRGLRAILEELLLDVMFEVPSTEDVVQVVVIREAVLGKMQPELVASSRVARRRGLSA